MKDVLLPTPSYGVRFAEPSERKIRGSCACGGFFCKMFVAVKYVIGTSGLGPHVRESPRINNMTHHTIGDPQSWGMYINRFTPGPLVAEPTISCYLSLIPDWRICMSVVVGGAGSMAFTVLHTRQWIMSNVLHTLELVQVNGTEMSI